MGMPARGLDKLEQKHYDFMDWLLSAEYVVDKKPIKYYADTRHISTRTLFYWKNDARFKKEWEKRAYQNHRDPERLARMLDVLYRRAVEEGDMKAMEMHFKLMDRMTPDRTIVQTEVSMADLTDEQLDALIAQEAKNVKGTRAEPSDI